MPLMSHVSVSYPCPWRMSYLKMAQLHETIFLQAMSHGNKLNVACRITEMAGRPVDFRGQWPFYWHIDPDLDRAHVTPTMKP